MAGDQFRENWLTQLQTSFLNHRNEPTLGMYVDADYIDMARKVEDIVNLLYRSSISKYTTKIQAIINSVNQSAGVVILLLKGRKRPDEVAGAADIQNFLQSIEASKIPCESCKQVQAVKIGGLYSGTGESSRFRYQCWACEYEWTGSPKFGL